MNGQGHSTVLPQERGTDHCRGSPHTSCDAADAETTAVEGKTDNRPVLQVLSDSGNLQNGSRASSADHVCKSWLSITQPSHPDKLSAFISCAQTEAVGDKVVLPEDAQQV